MNTLEGALEVGNFLNKGGLERQAYQLLREDPQLNGYSLNQMYNALDRVRKRYDSLAQPHTLVDKLNTLSETVSNIPLVGKLPPFRYGVGALLDIASKVPSLYYALRDAIKTGDARIISLKGGEALAELKSDLVERFAGKKGAYLLQQLINRDYEAVRNIISSSLHDELRAEVGLEPRSLGQKLYGAAKKQYGNARLIPQNRIIGPSLLAA